MPEVTLREPISEALPVTTSPPAPLTVGMTCTLPTEPKVRLVVLTLTVPERLIERVAAVDLRHIFQRSGLEVQSTNDRPGRPYRLWCAAFAEIQRSTAESQGSGGDRHRCWCWW